MGEHGRFGRGPVGGIPARRSSGEPGGIGLRLGLALALGGGALVRAGSLPANGAGSGGGLPPTPIAAVSPPLASQMPPPVPPQVRAPFTHRDHESVECETCHTGVDGHGSLSVRTVEDCRVCHHRPPLSASCESCHEGSGSPGSFRAVRPVSFSVGTTDPARALTFPHPAHAGIACARCHTRGLALAVPGDLDCSSCHADHHAPRSDCAACHRAAPVAAHPPSEAHVTCSGAGCHQRVPFQTIPRTRSFCLGCHQTMREHEAPRPCVECHALPAPRPQPGGAG